MIKRSTTVFWCGLALAAIAAGVALATLVWRDWIELVLHVDPDGGSGTLEWAIVAAAWTVCAASAAGACREWRRAAAPA